MQNFIDLFSQHAGSSYIRQINLADLIEDRGWSLTLSEGKVKFGDDLEFPIQLIGTESEYDSSWMWAWANTQSNLPASLLELSLRLKTYGEENNLEVFTAPHFKLEHFNGYVIAMLASSLAGDRCMFRGPYDGGAIYFTIENTPDDIQKKAPFEKILSTLSHMISGFELNHRIFAESFLEQQGFNLSVNPELIEGIRNEKELVKVKFDELGRIADISGTANPE